MTNPQGLLKPGETLGAPVQAPASSDSSSLLKPGESLGGSSTSEQPGLLERGINLNSGIQEGVNQGVGETIHGVGDLIRKGIGAAGAISPSRIGEMTGAIPKGTTDDLTKKLQDFVIPEQGQKALELGTQTPTAQSTEQHVGQMVGYGGRLSLNFFSATKL